ncbi:MAG: ATP-binding protein [Chloroflexota bacterium]
MAGERRLDFATRKALALLVYLAVEKEQKRREALAVLFWPESDRSRARANLRNTLNYLRNALPATADGETPHLLIDRDTLAFNHTAPYFLDMEQLESAAAGDDPELMHAALDCYRGDFLDGFGLDDAPAFDQWVAVQREAVYRRLDELFDRLSRLQLRSGRAQHGQKTIERWVTTHPMQEEAYRRLMKVYLAQGNRAGALRTYEQCAAILQEELGVAPSPATEALRARAAQAETDSTPLPTAAEADTPHFREGPLVGRQHAFATLVEEYHHAARHGPRAVAIVGEAGIGKTRLGRDFTAWASASGADVLTGRSFHSGNRLPYQPLIDALRPRVERVNAPEDLLEDVWLAALSQLLPELHERYPDLAPPTDAPAGPDARSRLFEAVARLFISLAQHLPQENPLLLWLDDLQWSDEATLDLLRYCCRRWQEQKIPILLLLGSRPGALQARATAESSQLADSLHGLERDMHLTRLELGPFDAGDTAEFVTTFAAEDASAAAVDRFVSWIQSETGGQPFYLVETLQELAQQGLWPLTNARWEANRTRQTPSPAPLPERVRRLINNRIARLSAAAYDLLIAAAVLAREFPFDLLCKVAAASQSEALRALDELLQAQLLREMPQQTQTAGDILYTFTHDKIRDVAYDEAGAARRRVFHRRALDILRRQEVAPARVAHHALAAGERAAAFTYSLAAGDEAMRVYAAREAIVHYQQAQSLIEAVAQPPLQRLYVQLGRAYELLGEYDAALAVYERLQTLAQEQDDRALQLAALMARTTVYAAPTQYYDPQSVHMLSEQALPLAEELEDYAAEAKIHWNLMLLKLFTGELQEAVAHGERSLHVARRHGPPQREAYALHDLTRAYLFSGRPDDAVRAGRQAQQLWRELDNQAMLADILVTTSSLMALRGQLHEVLPRLDEVLALSRRIDNVWNQAYASHIQGIVYFELGRLGQSIQASQRSIELGQKAGFMIPTITNGSLLALTYSYLGSPDAGFPWAERALDHAKEMHKRQTAGPLATLAHLYLQQGDTSKAVELAQKALARMEVDELSMGVFLALPVAAEVALARDNYEQVIAYCDRYLSFMEQRQMVPFTCDARLTKARALLAAGERKAARSLLQETREEADTIGARRILLPLLLTLADITEDNDALRDEAAATARFIADHVADDELRRSFHARPDVSRVLNNSG